MDDRDQYLKGFKGKKSGEESKCLEKTKKKTLVGGKGNLLGNWGRSTSWKI